MSSFALSRCRQFPIFQQRIHRPNLPRASKCWASATTTKATERNLLQWLQSNGAKEQSLTINTVEVAGSLKPVDVAVAARDLQAGDVALSIPLNLSVTLDQVFKDDSLAELLTTDKLSELACLALYLMYEKKIGRKSFWYDLIKELDVQRARGPLAVESPLLWQQEELTELLQGSPLVPIVKQRLSAIEKEYEELDTVWFMAGSLFNQYPFDLPTETFSFSLFRQAFAAVQASVVHLQGVPIAKRFALVPLGPPLLSYSSTSKAMLAVNPSTGCVELVLDRPYQAGERVYAWCGPQPNSRLLLNYGIVDENNPYDRLQINVSITNTDPLVQQKRALLLDNQLSLNQAFNLQRNVPLPAQLLPYLRIAFASDLSQISQSIMEQPEQSADASVEIAARSHLAAHLQCKLAGYRHSVAEDERIIADPDASPRRQVAARLTKIEKSILQCALDHTASALGTAPQTTTGNGTSAYHVKFS